VRLLMLEFTEYFPYNVAVIFITLQKDQCLWQLS